MSWAIFAALVTLAPSMYGSIAVLAGSGRFWLSTLNATIPCFITSFAMEVGQPLIHFYFKQAGPSKMGVGIPEKGHVLCSLGFGYTLFCLWYVFVGCVGTVVLLHVRAETESDW